MRCTPHGGVEARRGRRSRSLSPRWDRCPTFTGTWPRETSPSSGRADDVHGADVPAQTVRIGAPAQPLRAGLPRPPPTRPVRRGPLPALRAGGRPARARGSHRRRGRAGGDVPSGRDGAGRHVRPACSRTRSDLRFGSQPPLPGRRHRRRCRPTRRRRADTDEPQTLLDAVDADPDPAHGRARQIVIGDPNHDGRNVETALFTAGLRLRRPALQRPNGPVGRSPTPAHRPPLTDPR